MLYSMILWMLGVGQIAEATTNSFAIPPSLEIASKLAPVLSVCIALLGVIFVSYQILLVRRSHQTNTFLKILEMAREKSFSDASNWVKYEMEDSISYQSASADRETWGKISRVVHYFEAVGILVARGFINRDLVFDQMGPWIGGTWHKFKPLIQHHRTQKSYPDYAENFEILAEAFDKWAKETRAKKESRPRLRLDSSSTYYSRKEERSSPAP